MAAVLAFASQLAAFSPRTSSAQAPPPPAEDPPTKSDPAPQAPAQTPPPTATPSDTSNAAEVSTHDNPATFKVRVNLVLVRAVVRDNQGNVVTGLKKEDFQISDNRKPQIVSTFSIETPESHKLPASTPPPAGEPESEAAATAAAVAALPQRFVAVVFDDTNMLMQDAA